MEKIIEIIEYETAGEYCRMSGFEIVTTEQNIKLYIDNADMLLALKRRGFTVGWKALSMLAPSSDFTTVFISIQQLYDSVGAEPNQPNSTYNLINFAVSNLRERIAG